MRTSKPSDRLELLDESASVFQQLRVMGLDMVDWMDAHPEFQEDMEPVVEEVLQSFHHLQHANSLLFAQTVPIERQGERPPWGGRVEDITEANPEEGPLHS